jgi:hypothetical protein
MTMVFRLALRCAALFIAASTVCGCNLSTRNQTPFNFKWSMPDDLVPASETLNGVPTVERLLELGGDPAYRFLLETKQDSLVSNVRAYVTVNDIEYPMLSPPNDNGSHLWTFVIPDECSISYRYFFRVTWSIPVYGSQTRHIHSAAQPAAVNVRNPGTMVWWSGAAMEQTSGAGYAVLRDDWPRTAKLHVQNRQSSARRRINRIELDTSNPDSSKFQLLNLPALPLVIGCGGRTSFEVQWNPTGPVSGPESDRDDAVNVLIHESHEASVAGGGGTVWVPNTVPYVIPVKGVPPPG